MLRPFAPQLKGVILRSPRRPKVSAGALRYFRIGDNATASTLLSRCNPERSAAESKDQRLSFVSPWPTTHDRDGMIRRWTPLKRRKQSRKASLAVFATFLTQGEMPISQATWAGRCQCWLRLRETLPSDEN